MAHPWCGPLPRRAILPIKAWFARWKAPSDRRQGYCRCCEEALRETNDPYEILARIVPAADASVERTPDLLPVLKQAGVLTRAARACSSSGRNAALHLW